MTRIKIVISLWAMLLVAGCAGIGPLTVSRDRFVFTLVETGEKGTAPVVTVPTN